MEVLLQTFSSIIDHITKKSLDRVNIVKTYTYILILNNYFMYLLKDILFLIIPQNVKIDFLA